MKIVYNTSPLILSKKNKFRKTITQCELAGLNSIHIEMLMGHDIGLDASYHKPKEKQLIDDYLKAVPLLTIEESNKNIDKITAEVTRKVTQELAMKYEEQNNKLLERILLMEFEKVRDMMINQKRLHNDGFYITAQEQSDYFKQYGSRKEEDLEIIKQLLHSGKIEDYYEESNDEIETDNKIKERLNKYGGTKLEDVKGTAMHLMKRII